MRVLQALWAYLPRADDYKKCRSRFLPLEGIAVFRKEEGFTIGQVLAVKQLKTYGVHPREKASKEEPHG